MDEFRLALIATRILAVLLLVLGLGWFFAWALAAGNDWVFTGDLGRSSFRLTWSTYAMVYAVAGIVLGRFDKQVAKIVSKP